MRFNHGMSIRHVRDTKILYIKNKWLQENHFLTSSISYQQSISTMDLNPTSYQQSTSIMDLSPTSYQQSTSTMDLNPVVLNEPLNIMNHAHAMLQLLLEKRAIIVHLILELLDETASPDHGSQLSEHRRHKRFLKTSTFWEEDCQHMPEDKFFEFYKVSKAVFGEVLELIYPAILKTSVIGDTDEPAKKLALSLRYLATRDNINTLAHLFGMDCSSVPYILEVVTDAISTHPFAKTLVPFPATKEDFYLSTSSRKRKRTEIAAEEKRWVIADTLDKDLSDKNCVWFLGMEIQFSI